MFIIVADQQARRQPVARRRQELDVAEDDVAYPATAGRILGLVRRQQPLAAVVAGGRILKFLRHWLSLGIRAPVGIGAVDAVN